MNLEERENRNRTLRIVAIAVIVLAYILLLIGFVLFTDMPNTKENQLNGAGLSTEESKPNIENDDECRYISTGDANDLFISLAEINGVTVYWNYGALGYFSNNNNDIVEINVSKSHTIGSFEYYIGKETGNFINFNLGSGDYNIQVKVNDSTETGRVSVLVPDDAELMVSPSYYCRYANSKSEYTKLKNIADEIYEGCQDEVEYIQSIYELASSYEYKKSVLIDRYSLSEDFEPTLSPLEVYNEQYGVCTDASGFIAAMLRLENIPCKLQVGNFSSTSHAWVEVGIDTDVYLIDSVNKNFGLVDNFKQYFTKISF